MKKICRDIVFLSSIFVLLTGFVATASAQLQGFDQSYYLSVKLSALQASHAEWAGKTAGDLETYLADVGLTPEQHYSQYGYLEGLSPNPYFNHSEYIQAKATEMYNAGLYASVPEAETAFKAAWQGDAYLHYIQYGASEGINPSNSFDETAYLSDKLSALQLSGSDWTNYTIDDLRNLFTSINMTCLTHFLNYGKLEGLTATPVSVDSGTNHKPTANAISLSVASSIPYVEQQLSGSDPDGDTITYELMSNTSGVGYSFAYVNSTNGMLYVTNEPSGNDSFTLSYRVTDGQLFSDPATITIQVSYAADTVNTTGRNEIDPEQYSQFATSTYYSDLLGSTTQDQTQPQSVDLSMNFPEPGSQGSQSSCVGWAVAYALKSYQEKVEMGWSLNTRSHLFSPAFIYNQINGGVDQGSYIYQALDLIVNQGAATLATMPYSEYDYWSQPSSAAFAEASQYKGLRRVRVNDTSQIKAALVNRRPVVAGIDVYEPFYNLVGADSVYNTVSGQSLGGHAVTIVGYDDSRFGGAFKVINSWGQSWGDNGFFWIPYDFVSQVHLSESYVLEDAENGDVTTPTDVTEPVADNSTLPNLTVGTWHATYDPRPRGSGELTYTVVNSGAQTAYAGANINLMLSKNTEITYNDYYVIYETIPFDLAPGESVYRDSSNAISFQFPDQLEPGVYYMALWVDDLDAIAESNDSDNISLGDGTVTIQNSLPDLSVNTWYARWDGNGNGSLTYEVSNNGASATTSTTWDVNLILDQDQTVGNGNEIYLYFEDAGYVLRPGEYIYRDSGTSASFSLYTDAFGRQVPSGRYYMGLWVDDLNQVDESNETNNVSYGWDTVSISSGYGAEPAVASAAYIKGTSASTPGKIYNGKKLPPKSLMFQKVEISRSARDGSVAIKPMGVKIRPQSQPAPKIIRSRSHLIFPSAAKLPMPGIE